MTKTPKGFWVYSSYCTCGGYGRDQSKGNPHLNYCLQYDEWNKFKRQESKDE